MLFYDKGAKHKLLEHLLRVELICKAGLLKRIGVDTLADLQDKHKLMCLFSHLIKSVDACLFDDKGIEMSKLHKRTATFIYKFREIGSWEELKRTKPGNLQKYKTRFRQAIEKHGACNHQKMLLNELRAVAASNLT